MIHSGTPRLAAAALLLSAVSLCAASPSLAQSPHKKPKAPTSIPFVDDAKKPAADAAPKDAAPKKAAAGVPLLPGSGSKEPVNITADKLDFLNKENKLIYTGNVVVVQGDSTLKASVLNIDLQRDASGATAPGAAAPAAPAPAADGAAAPAAGNSSVKHMEADGPVTLISKDQVGTGDHATYDKAENLVRLIGNVTLSQGTNVTQGDRLVYDMTTGRAQVFSNADKRVVSVFTPGSGAPDAAKPAPAAPAAKPKPAKTARRGEAGAARDAEAAQ